MQRLFPIVFALFVPVLCSADESTTAKNSSLGSEIATLIVDGLRSERAAVSAEIAAANLPNAYVDEKQLWNNSLADAINADSLVPSFAATDASGLDTREMGELLRFYNSPAGRQIQALQRRLRAKAKRELAIIEYASRIRKDTQSNIQKQINGAPEPTQRVLRAAMQAPAISPASLLGRWYANEVDDNGNGYVGWHEKQLNGTVQARGLDVNHNDRTYSATNFNGVWFLKGRLLAETNGDDDSFSDLYIIESVSETELKFRFVDESVPKSDWQLFIDTRTEVDIPDPPKGYKDSYE